MITDSIITFQHRVAAWLVACFGRPTATELTQRQHRFLEEALELVQSAGCTASEAHRLVDYVFGRPAGEPFQEAGGVLITFAGLCGRLGIDMAEAGHAELTRCWSNIDRIRAKQAAKPLHSPLPGPTPSFDGARPATGRLAYIDLEGGSDARR